MISPMTVPGIIAIAILLSICQNSSSWVITKYEPLLQTRQFPSFTAIYSRPDIFYEDESDCPDEDECEIDWGAMPGFEDNNDEEDKITEEDPKQDEKTTSNMFNKDLDPNHHLIGDEMDELEPQDAYVRQVERSIEKSRTIFEMNWQIENCVVDEDNCIDFCADCAGSGKSRCNFCRGTRIIAFEKEFRPCLICNEEGQVECSSCSGTGSISPWAKTHDGDVFRRSDN